MRCFWQRYSVISLLDEDVVTAGHEGQDRTDEPQGSSSVPKQSAENPAGASPKRKRADNVQAGNGAPETAQALAKVRSSQENTKTKNPNSTLPRLRHGAVY